MSKQTKKMTLISSVGLIICLLVIWAFTPSESPIDYLNRVDQSMGTYVQSKTFGDLKFEMKYKPPAYQAASQILKSNGQNTYSFDELRKEFEESLSLQLRLENNKGGALVKGMVNEIGGYQELIQYLSFSVQEDLLLFTSQDTLECAFVHFERNYDLAPFTNIELGFNLQNISQPLRTEEEWVVQFNAERFGLGPLNFRFQSNEVNENPSFTF